MPLLLFGAASVVYLALGNAIEPSEIIQRIPIYSLSLIFVLNVGFVFLLGGRQEEIGWRGFALPRLLDRFDAVTASLVIGAVWAVWHLPLLVMEGSSQHGGSFRTRFPSWRCRFAIALVIAYGRDLRSR